MFTGKQVVKLGKRLRDADELIQVT